MFTETSCHCLSPSIYGQGPKFAVLGSISAPETGQSTRITYGEFNWHFGGHACTLEKSVFYKSGSYTRVLNFVILYKNCATKPSWRFGEISVDTHRKIGQIGPWKRLRHPYRWRYKNPVKSISIRNLIPTGVCFLKKFDPRPIKAVRREKPANFVNLLK